MGKKIMDKFQAISFKISQNTVLQVIARSFMMIFPFMFIGSIFTLISGFPITPWLNFIEETGLVNILKVPIQFTTNSISIYLSFTVGYNYCVRKGLKEHAISAGLISIFAFLLLLPYGEELPFTYIGAQGMFLALFSSILVSNIILLVNRRKWTIKMPESVPPYVANAFTQLIPAVMISFIYLIIRGLFTMTPWGDPATALYTALQAPLGVVSYGPWGVAILETFSWLLWWFGIHGGAVVSNTKTMLFQEARIENMTAYAAGQTIPNINTGLFLSVSVLPIPVMTLLFCKSKRARSVAKVGLVPAIFGISEPTSFGLPCVMNPLMLIPFVMTYPVAVFYTYFLNLVGLLPYCNGIDLKNIPQVIVAFLRFGGLPGVFWWCILFVIICAMYYPFLKALDKQYLADEQQSEAAEAAETAEAIAD